MSERAAHAMRDTFAIAMARRGGGQDDEVRRLLDERVSAWRCSALDPVDSTPTAAPSAGGALGALVDQIAAHAVVQPPTFPELAALGEFRRLWSALRAESQLQQSLQPAHPDAGPLNSAGLVHRSIALMRELSPGYLQQFLAYVDDLVWMEQLAGSGTLATAEAPGKRPRRKPRA